MNSSVIHKYNLLVLLQVGDCHVEFTRDRKEWKQQIITEINKFKKREQSAQNNPLPAPFLTADSIFVSASVAVFVPFAVASLKGCENIGLSNWKPYQLRLCLLA